MQSRTLVTVRYPETDAMGVVYHAVYFQYFELGRLGLLRQHGISYRDIESAGIALPVKKAEIEFFGSARFDDELCVLTTPADIRGASVRFHYEIIRTEDNKRLVTGNTLHAIVNRELRPIRPPELLKKLFTEWVEAFSL